MRTLIPLSLFAVFTVASLQATAQTYSSNNPGLFGIDGDINSDAVLNGSFTAAGSHDWFKLSSGTGIGVFDTTGAAVAKAQISAGKNYSFTKKMQQLKFSTHAGMLLLDATYSRDDLGLNATQVDKTMFNSAFGNTSAMNPSNWTGLTAGGAPQDKTDILDTYVHVRRLTNSNNHLIAYVGASTLGTTGNRYFDFELYKSKISYDKATGIFSNSGSAATGGHSPFTFNTDGSILSYGDMSLSISFNSSSVQSIDIYIWTDYNTYNSFVPRDFDFTSKSWVGLSQNSGYGYAKIQPKAGNTLSAWGMVNTSNIPAPAWGTNSKDLGSNVQGYYSTNYGTGQFGEAAIDLTSLGIDPYLGSSTSPCAPPYTRVFIKSRASSSFAAALADFIEPFDFLDASGAPATISPPPTLTCNVSTTVLQPLSIQPNTTYVWSTSNGSITSRSDSTYAVIAGGGRYYLTTTVNGCNVSNVDSITVSEDDYAPVATAFYTGVLTSNPASFVTLKGGDAVASNYSTPFGSSQGLLWSWSGPNSFTSATQDATTTVGGQYQLVLTEQRNGCRDTAVVTVLASNSILASGMIGISGSLQDNNVQINWSVAENELIDRFEIEKSVNNGAFVFSSSVAGSGKAGMQRYRATDMLTGTQEVAYRVRVIQKDRLMLVSREIRIALKASSDDIRLMQNLVDNRIAFQFQSSSQGTGIVNVYHVNGTRLTSKKANINVGTNNDSLELGNHLGSGVYILELVTGRKRTAVRFIKK